MSEELAHVHELERTIKGMQHNVVCIPEGFPGAEEIRQNIEIFMRKNATKVAHLIMVIHEPQEVAR